MLELIIWIKKKYLTTLILLFVDIRTQPSAGKAYVCSTIIEKAGKFLPCISNLIDKHSASFENNLKISDTAHTGPVCNTSN